MDNKIADLFKQHGEGLYRYAYATVWQKSAAEDVVSETFLRALANIDKAIAGKEKSWLFAIAHNVILETNREIMGQKNEGELEIAEIPDESQGAVEVLIDAELVSALKSKFALLDARTREVLSLKLWGDYKFSEITELTGEKEATVKWRYYKGLETLKIELNKDDSRTRRRYVVAIPVVLLALEKLPGSFPEFSLSGNLVNLFSSNKMKNDNLRPENTLGTTAGVTRTKLFLVVLATAVITALVAITGTILVAKIIEGNRPAVVGNTPVPMPSPEPQPAPAPQPNPHTPTPVPTPSSTESKYKTISDVIEFEDIFGDTGTIIGKYKFTAQVEKEANSESILNVKGQDYELWVGLAYDGGPGSSVSMGFKPLSNPDVSGLYRNNKPYDYDDYQYEYFSGYTAQCDKITDPNESCTGSAVGFKNAAAFDIRCKATTSSALAKCDDFVSKLSVDEVK